MKKNWTVQQIAEHVIEFYKLTPDEIYELEEKLYDLRKKAV
jgi:hypothetical protein